MLLYDETRQWLVFALTAGNAQSEMKLRGQMVPLGQGITGLAAATSDLQIGTTTYTGSRAKGDRFRHPQALRREFRQPMIRR